MHSRLLFPLPLLALSLSLPAPAQAPPTPAPPPARPLRTLLPALSGGAPPEGGWLPLEHYASSGGADDFYTADPAERATVATILHYRDLGTAGYVYPGPGGAVPLYRYFSHALGTHYYTADPSQRPAPASGYVYEGVAGWLAHGAVTAPGLAAIPATAYVYVFRAPPPAPVGAAPTSAPAVKAAPADQPSERSNNKARAQDLAERQGLFCGEAAVRWRQRKS